MHLYDNAPSIGGHICPTMWHLIMYTATQNNTIEIREHTFLYWFQYFNTFLYSQLKITNNFSELINGRNRCLLHLRYIRLSRQPKRSSCEQCVINRCVLVMFCCGYEQESTNSCRLYVFSRGPFKVHFIIKHDYIFWNYFRLYYNFIVL